MASLSNCKASHKDCYQHQCNQPPLLGWCYDGRCVQEWSSAVQTLRNNVMGSTLLASTALTLSSLIAVLMTSSSGDRSTWFIFGDRCDLFFSIKVFLTLVCFFVAFLLNVQSIKYYSHASILINVPFKKMPSNVHHHQLTAEYI